MKHFLYLTILFSGLSVLALPLEKEGKQEAELFNTFLQAVTPVGKDMPSVFAGLEQTLALDPDSKYIRRLLVSSALAMNKPQQATPYVNFIDMGENDAEDWSTYGTYEWQTGHLSQAQEAYQKSLELDPDNNQVQYQYLLLISSLDMGKAIPALEDVATKYPGMAATAYLAAGRLYARQQNFPPALVYLDKSIKANPEDPAPRITKSEIYEKTSQFFLLLHELEELEKMGYANAGTLSRMGAIFLLVKDVPKAKTYFLKAKAADDKDGPANYFLSLLAEQDGDLEGAINYLKAASDYPTKSAYWLQVAFFEQRLGRPGDSLRTLEGAYKQFPGSVEIGFFYGLALNDNKSYKKAANVFEKILQTNPDYDDARLHYAYSLESLHKYKDMEAQVKMLLNKNPNNAAALNLYAYSLAERNTRLDEAQGYIARALGQMPQDYSFIDTQAWLYVKQGELDKAEQLFFSIPADIIQNNGEIAYHIGLLLEKQGRREEALKYLEIAQKDWPAAIKLHKKLQQK